MPEYKGNNVFAIRNRVIAIGYSFMLSNAILNRKIKAKLRRKGCTIERSEYFGWKYMIKW
jgi:hypothetical protein